MKHLAILVIAFICIFITGIVLAADVAPPDIKQPGTQQGEAAISSPGNCGCHFNYDEAVEPGQNWRGSMMGNASRDPIFWATMAIAEQDFDGAGDLCLRCHTTIGWYGGTSEPTDGSNVTSTDGVDCHTCHLMTNTDQSEWPGTMIYPFIARSGTEGFYGSGMLSLWNTRVGPYADAVANHAVEKSFFHRSIDFCGSCHDVSNPVVGNLAPNNGRQVTSGTVIADFTLGGTIVTKAAFNNPPYMYGIVERTYSEYKSGSLSKTLVADFTSLPVDLQDGALLNAYNLAIASNPGGNGNYVDGDPRYFSCQTCHQPPVTGWGCSKTRQAPERSDLPYHDMTGGNYWIGDIIFYQHDNNQLITVREMGERLTTDQVRAINAGGTRAMAQLDMAASLEVTGNTLKVTNLTGHKLISGYPEGRRMWLNIKWYDGGDSLIREDGAYGPIGAVITNPVDGGTYAVESIVDLHDPNSKIYDAHYAITEDWADVLLALHPGSLALSYDRMTGLPDKTLQQLANDAPGSYCETFHFVLNNYISEDDRIPPYGMSYDEAAKRNALPVPLDQYGNPGPGGVYNYWDEVQMNPPGGAARAEISLLYQGTSWEYIQFLWLANNKSIPFLAEEGDYMLDSWLNTGMAAPYVMGTASWEATGVMVDIYVNLQGDNRPKWEGWEVPITVGLFNPGSDVMTDIPLYTFNGTTTAAPYGGGTRAYFQCPDPVEAGTYDITADSTTTLLNVKRGVGIW